MPMPRALPVLLGSVALVATSCIIIIHVILAGHLNQPSPVRTTAILASVMESISLVVLAWMFSTYLTVVLREPSKRFLSIAFGLSVLACAVATVSSVAAMICLSNSSKVSSESLLGANQLSFLIGSSVALGLAFASQLIFIVFHFVLAKIPPQEFAQSLHTEEARPTVEVKSIPYSQTSPLGQRTRASTSMESRSPPPSSSGRSAIETMSLIRSSFSNVVRPVSSKTRLLSMREKRRPASLDSNQDRSSITEEGFDSWDTSAVDPQNRQTVLDTSSPPPGRFLETIPASPTTSRSPSPGCPLDLEPPRSRRRSRSYSPAPTRRPRAQLTLQPSSSESHIHPLFRSDSPTPPPVATPGTIVHAAPNAGLVISDRQSIRTLHRMRSGSLPPVPSPLSRQSSFDDLTPRQSTVGEEIHESQEEDDSDTPTERKMTPPIPDWILSAGTRSSLSGYNSRKLKIELGQEEAPEQEPPRTR